MTGEPHRPPDGDAAPPLSGAGTGGTEPIVGPGGRAVEGLGVDFLLQNLPDALIAVSPEGIVHFWSQGAERTFGYSAADALGRSITDLIVPPERADKLRREVNRALDSGAATIEVTGQRQDGGLVYVDIAMQVVRGADGRAELLTLSARDITRPKYLRQAQVLEARFRGLLETAPDAMVIVNRDGRIMLLNSHLERLFGYTREELLGQSVEVLVPGRFHHVHPDHRRGYFADLQPRVMGASLELYARRKDGVEFPVEISLSPMESEEGPLVTAAVRDITARTKVEAKFRGLLEAAPDAMVIVNRDGRITLVNSQTERLFGYTREELLGQSVEVLVPGRFVARHPGHRTAYFTNPYPRPMGRDLELYARRKDGTEIPVEISLSPLETEEGPLVTAAIRDVTERKRLEETRRLADELATRRAQEANRLKSEFLANMSHELRTPLNAIIGFAQLMHDGKVGPVSPDHQEFLGDILASSRHLLQLINDVLDLAKVESGKMELHPEPVDLPRLVGETRDILRTLLAQERMHLAVSIDPTLIGLVADPAKLKQVLYNYLSNALKFTPDEGQVTLRALPEGPAHFRLEVEDSGIGIKPDDLDRLFVEFQQLDASTAKKYPGTGLGLALTRRLVEAQGGHVGVHSTYGQGSTFFAVFPRVARIAAEPAPEPLAAMLPSGAPTILVVEDSARDRDWIAQTLTEAGYAVRTVGTGAAALRLAAETAFDAVTLDLLLPDMTGWDVLRAIRAGGPNRDVPVIVVTVVAERRAGDGFRVHDILVKPVKDSDLLASLTRAGLKADGTLKVLCVDDDPAVLKLVERSLPELGYQPVCAADGEAGLRAVAAGRPAAIVLDLLMPGMDGLEFLRRLRSTADGRRIPVIVWTMKDLTAAERTQLRSVAQAVVLKGPEGPAALLDELRAHVPHHQVETPRGGDA